MAEDTNSKKCGPKRAKSTRTPLRRDGFRAYISNRPSPPFALMGESLPKNNMPTTKWRPQQQQQQHKR